MPRSNAMFVTLGHLYYVSLTGLQLDFDDVKVFVK